MTHRNPWATKGRLYWWLAMLACAVLWFYGMTKLTHADDKPKPRKPETIIMTNGLRRINMVGKSPFLVRIVVMIDNPDESWYCPRVDVTFGEPPTDIKVGRESECEAWPDIDQPSWHFASEDIYGLLGPGEQDIKIKIKQGAKEELRHVYVHVVE